MDFLFDSFRKESMALVGKMIYFQWWIVSTNEGGGGILKYLELSNFFAPVPKNLSKRRIFYFGE